ncbi:MAG: hypothetical protein QXH24_02330 [Candidatus Bathyarchaeia archaeon]
MVRIAIFKYGNISDNDLFTILSTMEECYNRLMPHEVSLVDLYIFESSSLAKSFLMREYMSLGVSTTPFEERFFATHDAWRGIPRITLFLDKLKNLPEMVKVGGIRHEVGHTVLHGSLEYYLLALPLPLFKAMEEFNIPIEYARDILYLVSTAIKDYEVTRLLYTCGYKSDQVEYVKFLQKDNTEETLSWILSKGNSLLEVLCIASSLKVVGCTAPLLIDKNFGGEVRVGLARYLNYLPEELSKIIMDIAERDLVELGNDTIQNINYVLEKCYVIFNKILKR